MEIKVENIEKFYGKNHALHNVSFSLKSGEIVGLLGHNGAGKSTLIKCIMNVIKSYKGKILIDGKDIKKNQEIIAEECGFLLEPSFCDYLSAYDNLKLLEEITINRSGYSVDDILTMVSLKNASDKKVGEFSFGMRQRLGLAQVFLADSHFVILDEPTVGLDPIGIDIIKSLILKLSKAGTAVLFSSHQISDVFEICTRAIVMNSGEIVYDDTIDHLIKKKYKLFFDRPVSDELDLSHVTEDIVIQENEIMVNHIETVTSLMNDMTVSGFKIIDIDTEESLDYLKSYMNTGGKK